MGRLRSIYRIAADSPLLKMFLGVCAVVALTTTAMAHRQANAGKISAHYLTTPAVPAALELDAGRELKLVKASFDTHSPAVVAGTSSGFASRCEAWQGGEARTRLIVLEFSPLYRRPPPDRS
ncbi:MAG TPA: hypothetical protein VKU19_06660 [Bryobacteraceae bacterium]|nr:hypothetical protein [Bryobacteraceae bacterium]